MEQLKFQEIENLTAQALTDEKNKEEEQRDSSEDMLYKRHGTLFS